MPAMRALVVILLLLITTLLPGSASAADPVEGWNVEKLAGSLAFPVDVAFGPDGTLYYAELRTGQVRAIPPGADEPTDEPVAQVRSTSGGNGGFLGLVVDPRFEETGALFVYYTFTKSDGGKVNRVSRLDASGETVIVDDIPWAELHDGGRLVFTDDDTLVVTTGDNEKRDPAQDPDDLRGKTLRITRDGAPAPGNPDPASMIYTLGHRNPFGIAYDRASDTLYVTENGPDRGDEVNVLEAGGNYGWPKALGIAKDPRFVDPILAFAKPIGPTGATVLDGKLYFGDFNTGSVHRATRLANGSYAHDVVWEGPFSGAHVLDVEAGPDGKLYVATYDSLYVLAPDGTETTRGDVDEPVEDDEEPQTATPAGAAPPGNGTTPDVVPNGSDAQENVGDGDVEENLQAPVPAATLALVALVAVSLLRRR